MTGCRYTPILNRITSPPAESSSIWNPTWNQCQFFTGDVFAENDVEFRCLNRGEDGIEPELYEVKPVDSTIQREIWDEQADESLKRLVLMIRLPENEEFKSHTRRITIEKDPQDTVLMKVEVDTLTLWFRQVLFLPFFRHVDRGSANWSSMIPPQI